jgi:hypothetical protein
MTIIDEISICANQLANAGKKPTVALVKAKLRQAVPLPTLISTLKTWQHEPDFIAANSSQTNQIEAQKSTEESELINSIVNNAAIKAYIENIVSAELLDIKTELAELKNNLDGKLK